MLLLKIFLLATILFREAFSTDSESYKVAFPEPYQKYTFESKGRVQNYSDSIQVKNEIPRHDGVIERSPLANPKSITFNVFNPKQFPSSMKSLTNNFASQIKDTSKRSRKIDSKLVSVLIVKETIIWCTGCDPSINIVGGFYF